jgi:hypothetical protein
MVVFWWLFLISQSGWAGVPLVIKVAPEINEVTVRCTDGQVHTKTVQNGEISLDILPTSCAVSVTQRIGEVNKTGTWHCTPRGCTLEVPPHKPVTNGAGRINLIFLDAGAASSIELSCAGYRKRQSIDDFTVVFNDTPKEPCTAYAKGGSTAKSQPLTWGTYACTLTGPTLLCQAYKP